MLHRVRLPEELDDYVFQRSLRTHTDTDETILQLIREGMECAEKVTPDHRRLDTVRSQTRLLLALGWHDRWVAEYLNVSRKYVYALRRDMGLALPDNTDTSPATYTHPRKA